MDKTGRVSTLDAERTRMTDFVLQKDVVSLVGDSSLLGLERVLLSQRGSINASRTSRENSLPVNSVEGDYKALYPCSSVFAK